MKNKFDNLKNIDTKIRENTGTGQMALQVK